MPRRNRTAALSAAVLVSLLAAPAVAGAATDLTHSQRFGDRPNEIVDVARDGSFVVATQGKGVVKYDLTDLGKPQRSALQADLGALPGVVLGDGSGEELELERTDPEGFGVVFANTEPGPTSVALVRDEFVIAPYNATNDNVDPDGDEQVDPGDLTVDPVDGLVILRASDLGHVRTVLFDDDDPVTGIAGAPTGTPGVDPLLEVPDSVAVSPDGTRAVIAVENDREFGQPVTAGNPSPGGVPGFVRADTSAEDPADWRFDLVELPPALLAARGEQAQPEFVDVNDDNVAVGSIQEANAIAVFDLDDPAANPTLTDAQVRDVGSSTFLADVAATVPVAFGFDTPLTRERQPDTVQWIAGGSLIALANEGENGRFGGTRDVSIHNPDGTVVSKLGTAFEQATADYGFLGDERNLVDADDQNKGSEPEGMDAVTIDGRDYLLVLGERSEALSTWEVTVPQSPRLVSFVPTGEAPEGVKANARRGFVVVANEDVVNTQGDIGFMTLHRFTDSALLPEDRLIPRGDGTPYFDVRGLGASAAAETFATVDGTVPTRLLETAVGGRGYAPLRATAEVGGAGAGRVLQDVAPAPGGGAWVVSADDAFELAKLDADGAVVGGVKDVPGSGSRLSGVVVTPDGGTVYASSSNADTVFRYDVAADSFATIAVSGLSGSDRILDLALAGDGDLLAVEANPNSNVSAATITRLDAPSAGDNAIGAADRTVLATIPVAASRSGTDMTGLALLPGGELWGVSGSRDGGGHIGHADLRRLLELPAPVNRRRPALTGSAVVGQTLTCGDGTWSGAGSFTREWRRDGAPIAGATGATRTLTAADAGQRIACAVVAAGADAFAVAESAAVVPVPAAERGEQGGAGPTGPTGPTGPQGPGGRDGANGAPGRDGAAGPGGPAGPAGPGGPAGAAGPRGARGARGATPKVSVSCRLAGRRIRCTVRQAASRAQVVASRGGRVVRRARTTRAGKATFTVPRAGGRLTVKVAGRRVR